MLEIYPDIRHAHSCPLCGLPMPARGFVLAAGRSLGSGACGRCGRSFLFDLPVGFGLLYPFCLDQDSGEVFGPEVGAWFRDRLKRAWATRGQEQPATLDIELLEEKRQVVLCNCLDDVYGHVLFKLFGAARYLGRGGGEVGLAVLIPGSVRHLVPKGVAEVWRVDVPAGALSAWQPNLERKLAEAVRAKDRAWLGWCYPWPNPTVDIALFAKVSARPDLPAGSPRIVFCCREDRTWGGSVRTQARNLRKLGRMLLERFPNAALMLTGCCRPDPAIKGYQDYRTRLPDAGREQLWIDLWASADLVVGVHGSNMLLPTALARGAVILLPRERYANAFQDSLPNPELPEPRANLFALRTIYGGKGLKDVDASLVAGVACSLVSGRERFLAMERAAPIFADPAASAEDIARAMRSLERFRSPGGGGGGGRGGGAGA